MNSFAKGHFGLLVACVALALAFSCRDFGDDTPTTRGGAAPVGGAGEAGDFAGGVAGMNGGAGTTGDVDQSSPGGVSGAGGDQHDGSAGQNSAGAGGLGDGGANALAPLGPSAFGSRLALWLEASPETVSSGPDQHVVAWSDRTSNANDASARSPFQTPLFVDLGTEGHAVVRFEPSAGNVRDPMSLMVVDSPSLRFGTGDFSYVVVMRWSNDPRPELPLYSGTGVILGKQSSAKGFPGVLLMANYPTIFADATAATRLGVQLEVGGAFAVSYHDGFNDDAFRVYALRRSGSDVALFVNGEREGGAAVAAGFDLSATGQPMIIGGNPGQPLRGDIAEIVVLRGATTDAEFVGLGEHLKQKYQLK